jgi:hypothetical protein
MIEDLRHCKLIVLSILDILYNIFTHFSFFYPNILENY